MLSWLSLGKLFLSPNVILHLVVVVMVKEDRDADRLSSYKSVQREELFAILKADRQGQKGWFDFVAFASSVGTRTSENWQVL